MKRERRAIVTAIDNDFDYDYDKGEDDDDGVHSFNAQCNHNANQYK